MFDDRFARLKAALDRRQPDLAVLVDGIKKGGNLSAMMRSCEAVGVPTLHAVYDRGRVPVYKRSTGGANRWVEVRAHADIEQACTYLRERGLALVGAHYDETSTAYSEFDFTRPVAIVMGSEKFGLSEFSRQRVDHCVHIPMMGLCGALNVSAAAAVILFEAQRQRLAGGAYQRCHLDPERYAQLLFQWAHPEVARYCRRHGLAFPRMDPEDGRLLDYPEGFPGVRTKISPATEGL